MDNAKMPVGLLFELRAQDANDAIPERSVSELHKSLHITHGDGYGEQGW